MLLIGCLRLLVLNGDPKHQMSALGHKRKWCHARGMSVLPLKADMRQREWHVRYVPLADIT